MIENNIHIPVSVEINDQDYNECVKAHSTHFIISAWIIVYRAKKWNEIKYFNVYRGI